MAKSATTKKEQSTQPLFFKNPSPVLKDKHAEAGISGKIDYGFSKGTNSVPVTVREFSEICKDYPIVFSGPEHNDSVAVLGMQHSKNEFVNADGKWLRDTYIPAYIRKYPFAFMSSGKGAEEKLILCVDEASERFVKKAKKSDTKFFNGTEQTDSTKHALEYCLQFHRDSIVTGNFVKALRDAGLLIPKQITATFRNKEKPINLSGFHIVNEKKFQELDEKLVVQWHKNGYLSLIFMHMISLSNFNKLTALMK